MFRSADREPLSAHLPPALSLIAILTLVACTDSLNSAASPPATRVGQDADTIHARPIADPYRWLEGNDEEVAGWAAEQNEYAQAMLGTSAERQDVIRRIVELLRVEVATTPIERGGRYFFMKRPPDQDRFAIFLREGATGPDRKIIDPFQIGAAVSVSLASVAVDGGLVVYAVRRDGQEESEVRFWDVERGGDLAYRLPFARYTSVHILADGSGVYYVRLDADGPRLYYHSTRGPALNDVVVFGEEYGPDAVIAGAITRDEAGLGIAVFKGAAGEVAEVHYLPLGGESASRPIAAGMEASFLPTFAGDRILLHTDWLAPNGRILSLPLDAPSRSNWVEVVPESDGVIEGVSAAGGRIIVNTLRSVQSRLTVHDIGGAEVGTVELVAPGSVGSMTSSWTSPEVFFTFTSFTVPPTVFRYDVDDASMTVWHSPRVQLPAGIVVRQVQVASGDGTAVPMFVVHRDDLPLTGGNPAMLTGFGAFGVSLTPVVMAEAVIVAERGGVFALVNVRGGGELGEAWHDAGKGAGKTNAIDDFTAAAEWLTNEGLTSPQRLVAYGSTHGGFLVTAAMTRRPDLFRAVIADHPVSDLIRLRDHPASASWTDEYGSPDDPAELDALLGLSPYHNLGSGSDYPAVLVLSGGDSQVPAFHARKLAATLQAAGGDEPVLLRDITASGGVDPGLSLPVEYLADTLVFFLNLTR